MPRSGSLQFAPRVKAKKQYAKVGAWAKVKEPLPLAFGAYKVGMGHIIGIDTRKTSTTSGEELSIPVTILECPPLKISSARFYQKKGYGFEVEKEIFFKAEKELARKIKTKVNSKDLESINADDYARISVLFYTQPKLTGMSRKKPEVFEVELGGNNQEKLAYIKEHSDKEITLSSLFQENNLVDIHAITKGKGTQGPVKRFGIGLKAAKSEKGRRAPGSLGGWKGQQHWQWKVSHAGQMGYHQRTEYNKQILKISSNVEELPMKDFHKYGHIKSSYLFIKGSVAGPKKRLIILTKAIRVKKESSLPTIEKIILR